MQNRQQLKNNLHAKLLRQCRTVRTKLGLRTYFENTAHRLFIGLLFLDTSVEKCQEIIRGEGNGSLDMTTRRDLNSSYLKRYCAMSTPNPLVYWHWRHGIFNMSKMSLWNSCLYRLYNVSKLTSVKIQALSVSRSLTHTEIPKQITVPLMSICFHRHTITSVLSRLLSTAVCVCLNQPTYRGIFGTSPLYINNIFHYLHLLYLFNL